MKARALAAVLLLASATASADDRRSVKNLLDPGAHTVRLAPAVPTTIRALTLLAVPKQIFGPRGRFVRVAPVETTVWRVRARLVYVHHEYDGDVHLVLAEPDDAKVTMIAEIPLPELNQAHAKEWSAARGEIAERMLWGETNRLVIIEGVGFFDYPHEQFGVAKNAIELHPVLALTFEARS